MSLKTSLNWLVLLLVLEGKPTPSPFCSLLVILLRKFYWIKPRAIPKEKIIFPFKVQSYFDKEISLLEKKRKSHNWKKYCKKLYKTCKRSRQLLLKTRTQLLQFLDCSGAHLTACEFCEQIPLLPFPQMLSFPKERYLCCNLHLTRAESSPVPTKHVQCHFGYCPVSFLLHQLTDLNPSVISSSQQQDLSLKQSGCVYLSYYHATTLFVQWQCLVINVSEMTFEMTGEENS